MANSYVQYTGNGVNYAVPFQYLSKAHVAVTVDGVKVPFSWTSTNMVQLASEPGTAVIEIRRTTPNNARLVDFTDGSVLAADDLDNSALQFLFLSQEAQDVAGLAILPSGDGQWDAAGRRIENASDPVDDKDLVTQGWAKTAMASQLQQATQKANDAAGSASSAASSATAAQGSQNAAAGSQGAAKTSENNAAQSASAAAGSATTATQQASASSTSATNSAASAREADGHANDAAGFATAAAGSASSASTSAGQAAGSASAASGSASAANTSAGNAHTSEVNAAASAQAAAQSAAEAAAGGYSKQQTDTLLSAKADKTTTYTKTETDQAIVSQTSGKADASTVYTKTAADAKFATSTTVAAQLSSYVPRAGATLAIGSTFTFKSQGELGGAADGSLSTLIVSGDAAGGNCAQIGFVNEGRYGFYLGIRNDNNLAISGWSLGAYQSFRVWNEKNLPHVVRNMRWVWAGSLTGIQLNSMSGGSGGVVEPYDGAAVVGIGAANTAYMWSANWRYLQLQDQEGNWYTMTYAANN
jgi:hypothetical protein